MFRYNPAANYQLNGGPYVQILSGKDLYKQTIVVSARTDDTFPAQLNFAVFCALSACGVSSAHLNYTKHPMIRLVYRFHMYYHMRRILKKITGPLKSATRNWF